MKVLGVIPARGGSKGIPGKNIKDLSGKPLIAYTIGEALKSDLAHFVVSTDSEEIAEVSRELGAQVLMRPNELGQDATPTLPVLQHAASQLSEDYDAVMTLQPTSPFRRFQHINDAIELFSTNHDWDSLVSVVEVPHNMSPVSIMELKKGTVEAFQKKSEQVLRRQDKPVYYARNGAAIYITRSNRLGDFVFGGKIGAYVMSKLDSLDIDDQEDWILSELLMNYRNQSNTQY